MPSVFCGHKNSHELVTGSRALTEVFLPGTSRTIILLIDVAQCALTNPTPPAGAAGSGARVERFCAPTVPQKMKTIQRMDNGRTDRKMEEMDVPVNSICKRILTHT